MMTKLGSSEQLTDGNEYATNHLDGQGQEFSRLIVNRLLTQATFKNLPFKLAIEFKDGEKFDDVAFFNGSADEWWLFQAKHSVEPKEVLREAFFTEKGDFSMLKYFKSFQSIRQNWQHGGKKIRLFLFTNRHLHESVKSKKAEVDVMFCDGEHVQLLPEREDIKRIKSLVYTDICNSLVKSFNGDSRAIKLLRNQSKLISQILTQEEGRLKFSQSFLRNDPESEFYDHLRSAFNNKDMSAMTMKIPKECPDFWNNSEHDNANNVNDMVEAFFNDLVLSVSQPNVKKLAEIIQDEWNSWMKNRIRPDVFRKLTEDELKIPFETFKMCQLQWEDPYKITNIRQYLTLDDGIVYLESVKKKLDLYLQRYGRQGNVALDAAENYYVNRSIFFKQSQDPSDAMTDEELVERLYKNYNDHQCIVLLAEPGMGKSTLWQHLAFRMQQTYKDVEVFLIYLNDFGDDLQAIDKETNIEKAVDIMDSVISEQNKKLLLDPKRKVVMLLDAFDEPKEKTMRTILNFVEIIGKSKSNIKFLISSRVRCQEMLEKNKNTIFMSMVPFDAHHRGEFLRSVWKTKQRDRLKKFSTMLLEKFERDVSQDFIGSPLAMKMLAEVYKPSFEKFIQTPASEKSEQIPISISSLYEEFTKKCIFRTLVRFLKADIDEAAFMELLDPKIENTKFNYQLLAMNRVLPEFIMEENHRERLEKFHASIQKGQEESLLLATVNGSIQFSHRSFAEYFCAKYFFDQFCTYKTIRDANLEELFEGNLFVRKFFLRMLNDAMKLDFLKILRGMWKKVEICACQDNCSNLLSDVENVDKLQTLDTKNTTLLHVAAKSYACEAMDVLINRTVNIDVENDSNETPLYVACEEGHLDMVKLLVERGAQVNHRVGQAKAPLAVASFRGHSKVIDYLLSNSATINPKSNVECLPLHEAAKGGHLDAVRLLIRNKAEPKLVNSGQKTVLHEAAYSGNTAIVEEFVSIGIKINAQDKDGKIPLHYAAEEGHLDAVRVLITKGADGDINVQNQKGETPLHCASNMGKAEAVQLLISKGASVDLADSELRSALHNAALRGNKSIVEKLLHCNASIVKQDKFGKTPLHFAAEGGTLSITQLLINRKAKIDQEDSTQKTALHYAAISGATAVIEKLCKYGSNVNKMDKYGMSALHFSAKENQLNATELLIESGATVDLRDCNQKTSLHYAATSGGAAVIEKLLQSGADINALDNLGKTPLQHAVIKGFLDASLLLVSNGANVDHTDSKQQTSLHYAALNGNTAVMEVLLKGGARTDLSDAWNETPIYYAANRGNEDIVMLLANQIDPHNDPKYIIDECRGRSTSQLPSTVITAVGAANQGNEDIVMLLANKIDPHNDPKHIIDECQGRSTSRLSSTVITAVGATGAIPVEQEIAWPFRLLYLILFFVLLYAVHTTPINDDIALII